MLDDVCVVELGLWSVGVLGSLCFGGKLSKESCESKVGGI